MLGRCIWEIPIVITIAAAAVIFLVHTIRYKKREKDVEES